MEVTFDYVLLQPKAAGAQSVKMLCVGGGPRPDYHLIKPRPADNCITRAYLSYIHFPTYAERGSFHTVRPHILFTKQVMDSADIGIQCIRYFASEFGALKTLSR